MKLRTRQVRVNEPRANVARTLRNGAPRALWCDGLRGCRVSGMNIPFLDNWRKKHGSAFGVAVSPRVTAGPEGVAELLSECELLRSQAHEAGVELDDTVASLEALDQLVPRWREDEEALPWLGNDAGPVPRYGPRPHRCRARCG